MRPPLCAVRDWFVQRDTLATLAVWGASWWLIMGVLCALLVLVVAGLMVWRDDEKGSDER